MNGTRFGAIAPVLPIPFDRPWREVGELVARGVGRLDRHEQLLTEYDQAIAAVRRDRAAVLNAGVVSFQVDPDGVYVDGAAGFFKSDVFLDAGGRFAPIVEANPEEGVTLSLEEFSSALDGADAAIVVVNTDDDRALVENSPFWQASPIARDGRFVYTNFFTNGGGPLTAIGVAGVVDDLYATLQR